MTDTKTLPGLEWIKAKHAAASALDHANGLHLSAGLKTPGALPPGVHEVRWTDCEPRFMLASVRATGGDLDELRELARWVRDTFGLDDNKWQVEEDTEHNLYQAAQVVLNVISETDVSIDGQAALGALAEAIKDLEEAQA